MGMWQNKKGEFCHRCRHSPTHHLTPSPPLHPLRTPSLRFTPLRSTPLRIWQVLWVGQGSGSGQGQGYSIGTDFPP